jgi:hypothetical protein
MTIIAILILAAAVAYQVRVHKKVRAMGIRQLEEKNCLEIKRGNWPNIYSRELDRRELPWKVV